MTYYRCVRLMEDGLDLYWPIVRLIMLFLLCTVVIYNDDVDHS